MTKSTINDTTLQLNGRHVRTIFIKGARSNNLKNIDLHIPKNRLVVVTGVSGSGKSSLTMDTLYAEGQRRYVESLSSYARQFLGRMKKPDVDFIHGLCPAIAIEQKVSTSNARSTVGTLTEIYDYLRLLYARIGRTISPVSGREVKRHQVSDVVDYLKGLAPGTRVQVVAPLPRKYADRTVEVELKLLLQKGYTRVFIGGELMHIEDALERTDLPKGKTLAELDWQIELLVDRLAVPEEADDSFWVRVADSVNTAFYEGEGNCVIWHADGHREAFNNRFELDGIEFLEPNPQLFNFNNPYGACPKCQGFSKVMGIDEDKVVPDKTLSVYEGAIACWKGDKYGRWLDAFLAVAHHFDFPVHTPYEELTEAQRELLWTGNEYFRGINDFFKELEEKLYKIQNRVMLARYRGRTNCPECKGKRLRKEATWVKVGGKAITELVDLPADELLAFFENIELNEHDRTIARRLLVEITQRLRFMCDVGLEYLTLGRLSNTLSGGETQRLNLTRTLGSNLTSSLYILDEPSVGLHPRDTNRLVGVLKALRDLGNTVVVVEHEEDIIRSADYLIDIGPAAGVHGGEVVFAGPFDEIFAKANDSLTTQYLTGARTIPVPEIRRRVRRKIELRGASQHNLKRIDVTIPLHALTVISGVSGSGKSTLVRHILHPALCQHLGLPTPQAPGAHRALEGDLDRLTGVEYISQKPIGRSSRSNPVTYVKAWDAIRSLMAEQQLSRIRGFTPKYFSFNVEGGRCEACKGEGEQVVEMQFLADVRLVCEECGGKRFRKDVLEVEYRGKNIYDILEMTVEEALEFFADHKSIVQKLQPLYDVGLGYVRLGQSSSTLSGGEAQRVKLAYYLGQDNTSDHILFIFDEPTTGLHFHDVRQLLDALNALVEKGHSVVVVEHNLDVIKCADWVIDLGPEGGKKGGHLLYQGPPEGLVEVEQSWTGKYLAGKL